MRKSRKTLVAALVLGSVLGTSSNAWAQGSVDNISEVQAGISPNSQSATKPGIATLFSQVQTFDADGGPLTIPGEGAERVTIDFDNDLQILPGKSATKFETCGGQGGNDLDTSTTAQVAAVCSDAIVGSGQAQALIPTGGGPIQLELTITTVNGPPTVPGPACVTPSGPNTGGPEGCDYLGGRPQIILHAYNQAIAFITTVGGEIQDSNDVSADYGKRLFVSNAPDTAGDAGALILFNSAVGRTLTEVKRDGTKREVTKLYPYAKATCGDDGVAAGGTEYDFKATFVYDDNTVDTDTFKQKCGNPAP